MPELSSLLPEVLQVILVLLPFRDILSLMATDAAEAATEEWARRGCALNLSRLPTVGMPSSAVVNGLRAAARLLIHHGQITTIGGKSPGLAQKEESERSALAFLWEQVRSAVSVAHVDLHRTCTYFGTSASPYVHVDCVELFRGPNAQRAIFADLSDRVVRLGGVRHPVRSCDLISEFSWPVLRTVTLIFGEEWDPTPVVEEAVAFLVMGRVPCLRTVRIKGHKWDWHETATMRAPDGWRLTFCRVRTEEGRTTKSVHIVLKKEK